MSSPQPTNLSRVGAEDLLIEWSDGEKRQYSLRELRDSCPCATCREKRVSDSPAPNALNILTPAETRPLAITGMRPVGNYAYNIAYSDGHDTGIYPFELLRRLGNPV